MKPIDRYLAVIGCGYWGKNLVRNFAELGVLRAICDDNQQTLDKFKVQYDVEGVTDFDKILSMTDVKALVIATPASTHASLVIAALDAGKDVFVEKPLALTLEDALAIQAAANRSGCILMVGHLLEYHPALVKLRSIVAEGEIGKLRYLYSNRLSFGKIRTEENVLWSFAPHDICNIVGFLGVPISVQATGSNCLGQPEECCVLNLEFANNVKAHIFVSWFHPFKEHRLVVVGDTGTAVFDDVSVQEKLTLYRQQAELKQGIPALKDSCKNVIDIAQAEPLKLECQHFLECIHSRKTPVTSIQNGIDVLTVLQAAQLSLDRGNTIYLKEKAIVSR